VSDEDYQALYCRWAEQEFNLTGVRAVAFHAADGCYSDVTPGDPRLLVDITLADGRKPTYEREDLAALINSILKVARS
jgi:hypothetical protein